MGFLHPPGWKPNDACALCGENDPYLPHILWRCPALDHQRLREGALRSGGKTDKLSHRPLPSNTRAEEWWLSIHRSKYERRLIGGYLHAVHKERLRLLAERAEKNPQLGKRGARGGAQPVGAAGAQLLGAPLVDPRDIGEEVLPDLELGDQMDAGLLVQD